MSAVVGVRGPLALEAREAWMRRVLRVGGMIQAAFATFWLVRGSLAIGGAFGAPVAAVLGVAAISVFAYGARATVTSAPRPTTRGATEIERAVTIATALQIAASFALPAAAIAAGRPDWVLSAVAVTVGPLLVWLDHRLGVPRYGVAGWSLLVGPLALALLLRGDALTAVTGLTAGALMLAIAAAGFRDLVRT